MCFSVFTAARKFVLDNSGGRYIELFPSSSNVTSLLGREDQQSNTHFDYDIEAFPAKRRRSQVSFKYSLISLFL